MAVTRNGRVSSSTRRKKNKVKNMNKKKVTDLSICMLPREMVEEIVAVVAASSRLDLFRAKSSCRLFSEVANGDYVHRKMSLTGFPFEQNFMNTKQRSLFRKCLEVMNPNALYQEGLGCFLVDPTDESALKHLKIAADTGHVEASYVLGIDRLCNGDEREKKEAVKLLDSTVKTSQAMRACRADLALRFSQTAFRQGGGVSWATRFEFLRCPKIDSVRNPTPGWPILAGDEDRMTCRTCRWNVELFRAYAITHPISGHLCPPQRCERLIN